MIYWIVSIGLLVIILLLIWEEYRQEGKRKDMIKDLEEIQNDIREFKIQIKSNRNERSI